jgi:hypothetical protein
MLFPQSFRRLLRRLGPYLSLLVLAVPLAIAEPLKLVAIFVLGEGHFMAGIFVMLGAYAGSLFITDQLFLIVKPKLLTLPWFATIWSWFVAVRDKTLGGLRSAWTLGRKALFEQVR